MCVGLRLNISMSLMCCPCDLHELFMGFDYDCGNKVLSIDANRWCGGQVETEVFLLAFSPF